MKRIILCLMAGLSLTGGVAFAQDDDYGQVVFMEGPRVAVPASVSLTSDQRRALYPQRGPRPGVYRLRSLHSGLCATISRGSNNFNLQDRPMQQDCYREQIDWNRPHGQLFALMPHPDGGYTIRTFVGVTENGRAKVPGEISNCLTLARGVVLGPVQIEARGCDVPNGAGWDRAGAYDQRFMIQRVSGNVWEIRASVDNPESNDCMAARGGSRDRETDYIKWGCNDNPDQRFAIKWMGPIPTGVEQAALARSNWFPFADGHNRLSPANGVSLSGESYSIFETINDNGDYCMRRCAELSECKAWTWTGPNYVGNDPPQCHWKREAGSPINRGPSTFGKLFSGIVRF